MPSNCYGPNPVRVYEAYVKKVDNTPHFQYEMFRVLEDSYWDGDGWRKSTYYHWFPYDYAINYVRSFYEKAS